MKPRPGEVWLADLGLAEKTRPVVVVSRFDPEPPRSLIIYVPLTTQHRNSFYEVVLPTLSFLKLTSVANVQGIGSLPIVRLDRERGQVPKGTMIKIQRAILYALNLESEAYSQAQRRSGS